MRVKVVKGNDVVKVCDFEKGSTEPIITYANVEPPVITRAAVEPPVEIEPTEIEKILSWDGINRYHFPSGEEGDKLYHQTKRIVDSIMTRLGDNTKWTDVEIHFLISAYYDDWYFREMSKALNKSVRTINELFKKFRDVFPARRIHATQHKWSDEDKAFLKEHYNDMTYDELAKAQGQTSNAVATYASKHREELGLPYKDRK
jgi:hypothetical protein